MADDTVWAVEAVDMSVFVMGDIVAGAAESIRSFDVDMDNHFHQLLPQHLRVHSRHRLVSFVGYLQPA